MRDLILGMMSLLLSLEVFACKRNIVLDESKPVQSQLIWAKTCYHVKSAIDLGGKTIIMPAQSSLVFDDTGIIYNGTVFGNETTLVGSVRLSRVAGSFSKPFKSSFSSMQNNYDKLRMLLTLSIDELILDENFRINSFQGQINTKITALKGYNITINVETDCVNDRQLCPFLNFEEPVREFSGITFDFHNHACRNVIFVTKIGEKSFFKDITIRNIDIRHIPLSEYTFIQGLTVIADRKSNLSIANISAENFKSMANNIVGDTSGNISALYIYVNKDIPANIEIFDCSFRELHNYNTSGSIVLEDTNGIYVHETIPYSVLSKVYINNITGENFGKRLIKADAGNITVSNIYAKSKYYDTLSAISLNNYDNQYRDATIKNVFFSGTTKYVVGSAIADTKIQNIVSEITVAPETYTTVVFPMASCQVKRLRLQGAQQIAFVVQTKDLVTIEDVVYDDTVSKHSLYGNAPLIVADANIELSDVYIKSDKITRLLTDYNPNSEKYSTAATIRIKNLHSNHNKETKDWFIYLGGFVHNWDVAITESNFVFESEIRGPICIQEVGHGKQLQLLVKDTTFTFHHISEMTIPYGWLELDQHTIVLFDSCDVLNKSGRAFSSVIEGLYLVNKSEYPMYEKVKIKHCKINNRPLDKDGPQKVLVKGNDVKWQ